MQTGLVCRQLTTLRGLDNVTALQTLDAQHNELTILQGLEQATALETLHVDYNQLTSLQGLEQATALQRLSVDYNQLTTLQGLERATALRVLYVCHNHLTTLQGLERATALQTLYISNNLLTTLRGLERATALHYLSIGWNRLQFSHLQVNNATTWRKLCRYIHNEFVDISMTLCSRVPPYVCLHILEYTVPDARHWLHKSKIDLILAVYKSCTRNKIIFPGEKK